MIEVRNLTKRFGTTIAVDDISFDVPAGQVLGFLGPNGAGKTTTMRILTGYIPADRGSATIAGFNIIKDSLSVRKRIGYLPENAPLYLDMELPDFLNFIATVRKIPVDDRKSAIDRIIDMCGLEEVMAKKIGELSRGYKQRVGLAQAMIHNPDILVFDEPTSGLDPNQIVEIRKLIKELGEEKTVILSTHILQEVTATCDRILIISNGKLVADGSPDNLTAQAAGEITIWITIKGPPDTIKAKILEIPDVNEIHSFKTFDDRTRLSIRSNLQDRICEEIFNTAVINNWVLVEMFRETASLEDVFAKLTRQSMEVGNE